MGGMEQLMTTKPSIPLQTDKALHGGVTNEVPPNPKQTEAVRRRNDLTIRGADPKELSPQREWSERIGRATK
jgi:hypothetical protein